MSPGGWSKAKLMFLARRLTTFNQKLLVNRLLGRCFSSEYGYHKVELPPVDKAQSLLTAPTDVYLVCDTNLVIAYQMGKKNTAQLVGDEPLLEPVKGWYKYANKVAAHGDLP